MCRNQLVRHPHPCCSAPARSWSARLPQGPAGPPVSPVTRPPQLNTSHPPALSSHPRFASCSCCAFICASSGSPGTSGAVTFLTRPLFSLRLSPPLPSSPLPRCLANVSLRSSSPRPGLCHRGRGGCQNHRGRYRSKKMIKFQCPLFLLHLSCSFCLPGVVPNWCCSPAPSTAFVSIGRKPGEKNLRLKKKLPGSIKRNKV